MSPARTQRSPEPLEYDSRGRRINKHGPGGYARGCGCPECTAGRTAARQKKRGQLGPGGRLADQDKHTIHKTIRVSSNENALIDDLRGDTPWMQWCREAILARVSAEMGVAVGELDAVRRAAPRSRNHSERQREKETE